MNEDELRTHIRVMLDLMGYSDHTLRLRDSEPHVLITIASPDGAMESPSMGAGESTHDALVDLVSELTQEMAEQREKELQQAASFLRQAEKSRVVAARLEAFLIAHGNRQPRRYPAFNDTGMAFLGTHSSWSDTPTPVVSVEDWYFKSTGPGEGYGVRVWSDTGSVAHAYAVYRENPTEAWTRLFQLAKNIYAL